VRCEAALMNGMLMAREMAEQPARMRQLIRHFDEIAERVRAAAPVPLDGITMVARGSSDHAAVYGRYLLETATGKPVSLAAPSLYTLYGLKVDYRGQLVIAVSQSGATPEIVRTLQALQDGGGSGLAITNDPDSALARTSGRSGLYQRRRRSPASSRRWRSSRRRWAVSRLPDPNWTRYRIGSRPC